MYLLLFSSLASYRHLRAVAQRSPRQVTFLYAGAQDHVFQQVALECAVHDIEVVALDEAGVGDGARSSCLPWGSRIRVRPLLATAMLPLLKQAREAASLRREYCRRLMAARSFLDRIGPSAVFCCEDGISSELSVIAAARSRGVPVVDVPFGNATWHDLDNDLGQKAKEGRIVIPSGRDRRILDWIAPQWIKKGRHAGATMHKPAVILAWESLGMTLRDAWIIHGGMSDLLCAENPVALRQYRGEGIPEAKLRLTGSPYCDVMVDALRNAPDAAAAFRQPRRIEPATTRILVSWPPSYHGTYPERNEFASFADMTKAAFSFLKSLPNTRLTVSLHPACDGDIRQIFDELGISVAQEYLLELIPQNDIFTTYFSSTIRWALAAGKVVVNYDAYKADLTSYDDAPGFVNASDFGAYCLALEGLVDSEAKFAALATKQIAVADEWGAVDGQCTRRIFEETDRLIGSRRLWNRSH